MSFKNTWFLPSATRLKGHQRLFFRIALVLGPVLLAIGITALLTPFVHEFVAMTLAIIISLSIFPKLFNTTQEDTAQVKKYLNDTDYLENAVVIPKTDNLPDLDYFPSSKEWLVTGHIDPATFIKEIQSRDTLASSFDTDYLISHVKYVYTAKEHSPKLRRTALKVLPTDFPSAKPSTIIRIPPNENNEIKYNS